MVHFVTVNLQALFSDYKHNRGLSICQGAEATKVTAVV